MNNENKVLACVDQSHFADYVADFAAWAARRLDAPLELLHIIDRHPETAKDNDHSGAIGINAEKNLLNTLSAQDELSSKAARESGRIFLNRLRERVLVAGIQSPDVRQRYGELEETLVEQQDAVQLFVLGRRGESAEVTQRDLGRNVERIVRALARPILTITEGFTEPKRVLIAFDGGVVTRKGVDMVANSPLFKNLSLHLVMSGKESAEAARQVALAKSTLEAQGHEVTVAIIPGDAERVIAQYISEHAIDLLVMGGYSHSRLRTMLLGSKTSDLLRSAKIPTLLLR
ncbi:MAG: universal stress protein [Betaproteobacteria bacterium HGW-Betaproteobacteria-22]|nr:MAG: universal stress protein [Betaproteobacteria bacterium HGW-Betaproteobacteria-22]